MIAWLLRLFRLSPKKKQNRPLKREAILLSIEPISDTRYYSRTTDRELTGHELWDMGWHDAIWQSKPDPRYKQNAVYMRGWKESKG